MRTNRLYNLIRKTSKDELLKASLTTCKHGHSVLAHPQCFEQILGKEDIVGFFDIETTELDAETGVMLSYAIKMLDGPVIANCITTAEIMSDDQDKRLVASCIEDIRRLDRVIGHYSTGFDIPFIRTRALYHGLDFPKYKELWHTDTWQIIRKKLKLKRNSLQRACELLGIEAKGTSFDIRTWKKALYGRPDALATVLQHNIEDVLSTEALWKRVNEFANLTKSSI